MKLIIQLFTIMVVLLIGGPLISQDLTPNQEKEITEYLKSKIQEGAPGLAAGIVKDGEIIFEYYDGMANLQHQIPVDENTRFNIASVSKQFTALCILDLDLKGQLDLEDDLRKYFPEMYPKVKAPIQIKQMLNHSSGIRDVYNLLSIQQKPWWKQMGFDNQDALELLAKQQELNFTPGSDYLYSNSNYLLLAQIVEKVSGQNFHAYSNSLFNRLGMENSQFLKDYMLVIPNQALGYTNWGDGNWKQFPMVTSLYGDGFLFTTLKDQLIFEQAIQKADEENQLLIQSQKAIPNTKIQGYGFGLELGDRLNYPSVHHSGSTVSYHAQTVRFPSQKLSVFVMSNNGNIWSGFIADKLASILLPENSPKNEKEELTLNPNEDIFSKAELLGEYQKANKRIIRITEEEGKLYWRMDNNRPEELISADANTFYWQSNEKVKVSFSKEASGKMSFSYNYPGAEISTYKKMPTFSYGQAYLKSFAGKYSSEELSMSFDLFVDQGKLMIQLEGEKEFAEVQIIQNDALLLYDYIMQVERDVFDRVSDILITTDRVRNVRFKKKEENTFQPMIATQDGSIQVTTIGSRKHDRTDILLTKNDEKGNEQWYRRLGGNDYDKASSIIATLDGGYMIIGSTSSFGNGNYDIYLIKTDENGKEEWSKTYGGFLNEYGYMLKQEKNGSYLIKGKKQTCQSKDFSDCKMENWIFQVDSSGKEVE